MTKTVTATFVDSDLPALFAGAVLSVHGRAINILLESKDLATVVRAALGPGPNRIGIAFRQPQGSFPAWGVTPGMPVERKGNEVRLGDTVTLDLTTSMHSSSLVATGRIVPAAFEQNREALAPLLVRPQRIDAAGREFLRRSQALGELLGKGHADAIADTVRSLIGLGPGLTPSGDDFLVGLLCGWRAAGIVGSTPDCVRITILDSLDRTGLISRHYLTHACNHRFAAVLVAVASSLVSGTTEATLNSARWCLQFGATSGLDSLSGIYAAVADMSAS